MNNYLNYLVEANLGLVIILATYSLLLSKETEFHYQRVFLLSGILASLLFPLVHITFLQPFPSLSQLIPTYLLPEITIGNQGLHVSQQSFLGNINPWSIVELIYLAGLLFFLADIIRQL